MCSIRARVSKSLKKLHHFFFCFFCFFFFFFFGAEQNAFRNIYSGVRCTRQPSPSKIGPLGRWRAKKRIKKNLRIFIDVFVCRTLTQWQRRLCALTLTPPTHYESSRGRERGRGGEGECERKKMWFNSISYTISPLHRTAIKCMEMKMYTNVSAVVVAWVWQFF